MSEHSKWASIQHRKKSEQNNRAKFFARLSKEITAAARIGGGDPDSNSRLRLAVERASIAEMPESMIDLAMAVGAGEVDAAVCEDVRYEGHGPGGVAIMVDCLTNAPNRTVGEIRQAFTNNGGQLSEAGSVAGLFRAIGVLSYAPGSKENAVSHTALQFGADDVHVEPDGSIEVQTSAVDYCTVVSQMVTAGLEPDDSRVEMRAHEYLQLNAKTLQDVAQLIAALDDLEDTQEVSCNVLIPHTLSAG